MFVADNKSETTYHSWDRKFEAHGNGMTIGCQVFFDETAHVEAQFRIDYIVMGGLSIDVGGGPESHIDFPYAGPEGLILSRDIDEAITTLLGRLQAQCIRVEYPDHDQPDGWWNAPETTEDVDVDDDDDDFWF